MSRMSRGVWENINRRSETSASLISWINSKITRKPRSLDISKLFEQGYRTHGSQVSQSIVSVYRLSRLTSALLYICTLDFC